MPVSKKRKKQAPAKPKMTQKDNINRVLSISVPFGLSDAERSLVEKGISSYMDIFSSTISGFGGNPNLTKTGSEYSLTWTKTKFESISGPMVAFVLEVELYDNKLTPNLVSAVIATAFLDNRHILS